jgi:hypothetical protein
VYSSQPTSLGWGYIHQIIFVEEIAMPAGHANHKGTSDKPNVNANGLIGEAADKSGDAEDILLEGVTTNTTRTQEFVDYPPAIQRPGEQLAEKEEKEEK